MKTVTGVPRLSATARRRQVREKVIAAVITATAFLGIAALVLILVFVAKEALALLSRRRGAAGGEPLQDVPAPGGEGGKARDVRVAAGVVVPKVSMIPLFIGTLKTTLVSMVVAVPLAVAGALFAAEFAPRRLREVLKPTVELLAGIPSVVLGFFALMVLATPAAGHVRPQLAAQCHGGGPGAGAGHHPRHLHGGRGRAHRGAAQLPRGVAWRWAPPRGRRRGRWCCRRRPRASSPRACWASGAPSERR